MQRLFHVHADANKAQSSGQPEGWPLFNVSICVLKNPLGETLIPPWLSSLTQRRSTPGHLHMISKHTSD